MKRIIFIVCILLVSNVCGCSSKNKYMSNWFNSEQEIADNMMQQITNICNENDIEKFKNLFSKNSLKNVVDIDNQISSFFEFIDGDIKEFYGDCASSAENNHGSKKVELDGMYHISTTKNKYCVNFYMVYKNDDSPSDIGLYKIEIATEDTVNKEDFIWDTADKGVFIEFK